MRPGPATWLARRPLLLFVLALASGLVLRFHGGTAGLVAGLALVALGSTAIRPGPVLLALASGLVAGLLRGGREPAAMSLPGGGTPRLIRLAGEVVSPPRCGERGALTTRLATGSGAVPLTWTAPHRPLARGDVIRLTGIARGSAPARGGGPAWRVRTRGANLQVTAPAPWWWPPALLDRWRALLHRRLEGLPERARALARCLLLGDQGGLDQWEQLHFRHTGTAHLLVVSGLHVALLGGLVLLLTRGRGRLAALILVAVYATLAGGRPPALRAAIGFGLWILAPRLGRKADLAGALAAAALPVLILEPHRILGPSLQISYGAVTAMAIGGPRASRLLSLLPPWLARSLGWSLAATLGTAPLTLWHFGICSPASIILTPLLTPLLACLVLLAGLAPWLPGVTAPPLAGLHDLLLAFLTLVDRLPATPIFANHHPGPLLLGLTCSGALLLLLATRARLLPFLLLILPFHLPWVSPAPLRARGLLVALGHGQCLLLDLPGLGLVVSDAGTLGNSRRAATRVLDLLRAWGRPRIDLLCLSHLDRDHVSLLPLLLAGTRITRVVLPRQPGARTMAARLEACGCSCTIQPQGVTRSLGRGASRLTLFTPGIAGGGRNRSSLVLHLAAPGLTLLAPGDLEGPGLDRLIALGRGRRAQILVAPHHGAARGGEGRLVLAWGCRRVLVSRAWSSGPAPATRDWLQAGAGVSWTGRDGDLEIR